MKVRLSVVLAMWVAPLTAMAFSPNAQELTQEFKDNLTFIKSIYQTMYAPASWKAKYSDWSLGQEFAKAMQAAQSLPQLSLLDTRKILKNFIYSMKDYHVSISFESTEKATLPLTIKGANQKFFIVDIDRTKLSEDSFPFHEGDELVTFGEQTAEAAIASVQSERISNVDVTDRGLAEQILTRRSASRGYAVPQGPITLGIRPKGSDKIRTIQLIWDYSPEKIQGQHLKSTVRPQTSRLPVMSADVELGESSYDLGARKSFIPALGTKVMETSQDNPFHAYIFKTEDRKLIGYVRIPSYTPENSLAAVDAFSKIITQFEVATDALVIDQVNNPGGSVFYLYALVSMLSPEPLITPRHEMAINQTDIASALRFLGAMKEIKNDETAKKILGDTLDGFPVSYQVAGFMKNYLQFLVDEWNAGRSITRPYWIEGVDHINPNPIHYSKPILLLTNALDFSGGDFFPAILQDNHRVTILGTRTSGAGGYVNDVAYPNRLGIARFRITGSIAKRVSDNPIENLGVQPDIEYSLSETDLTQNYSEYVKAIRTAVSSLLKSEK